MSRNNLFPERPSVNPTIYAYEELSPEYKGLLKVGYTAVSVDDRVAKQHDIKHPDGKLPYRIVLREPALYPDGSSFTDHDVHRILKKKGFVHEGGEWFRCSKDDVLAAVVAVKTRTDNTENRIRSFTMRPEQEAA
ncbi:GIY-YIG nuclease family protein, partial [Candidatus Nomurabacteria bacterium]|nr:GIY-YIG nuclease family protein [Candidatus Nomurabacteria bacterium]